MNFKKNAILILLSALPFSVFGQVNNSNQGTAPKNLNQQLIDGVIKSQANNESLRENALRSNLNSRPSVMKPSANSAMTATPDGPAQGTELDLTDQEKILSQEFVHDGRNLRMQKELCENLGDPRACQGKEPDSKFLGMDSGMVQALSRAYTMIAGSMDSGIVMAKPDPAKASTETAPADQKTNDRKDYCKFIAVASEGVAFFQQNLSSKNAQLPMGSESAQKEALYRAARSHKDKAKTHRQQFIGWGLTTACYTAMMSTGADLTSVSNWAKLIGAGVLTKFFKQQADLNQGYYKKVMAIANKIGGKGDCNPITEKDCYCAQEETMNDPKICLPELHGQKVKLGNYRVACLDANGKVDPKCTCIDADACLDKRFKSDIRPFGFGTAFNSAALRPLSNISRGQLTAADLSSATSGKLSAFNRNGLSKLSSKAPSSGSLTAAQEKSVRELSELGLAPKLGALLIKQRPSASAKSNLAKFRRGAFGSPSGGSRSSFRKRGKVLNFSGGSGLNKKVQKRVRGNQFSSFMNKFKKKGNKQRSGKVLNYSDRALRSAQISKDKDRPIFEIISRRYKVSAFKRLEVE